MNATGISSKTNGRLNRILKVSKTLRSIFLAALIIEAASALALIIVISIAASHGLKSQHDLRIFHVTLASTATMKSQVVFENCGTAAALPFAFMVTLSLFRFFTQLKDGHLFDSQTVKHLEKAGRWWIMLGFVQIVFQISESCIFSSGDVTFSPNAVIGGMIVFFAAWLLGEAQKLQEEQELTV